MLRLYSCERLGREEGFPSSRWLRDIKYGKGSGKKKREKKLKKKKKCHENHASLGIMPGKLPFSKAICLPAVENPFNLFSSPNGYTQSNFCVPSYYVHKIQNETQQSHWKSQKYIVLISGEGDSFLRESKQAVNCYLLIYWKMFFCSPKFILCFIARRIFDPFIRDSCSVTLVPGDILQKHLALLKIQKWLSLRNSTLVIVQELVYLVTYRLLT